LYNKNEYMLAEVCSENVYGSLVWQVAVFATVSASRHRSTDLICI
jgi:hypothetical protein